MSELSRP